MKNTFILIFILLFLPSCKDEPITPKPEVILMLSVEDVSCTEAWLTLTTTNLQFPTSINLLKNDNLIKTINLQTADTLLYIDSLLPNQTYNIQAFTHSNNQSHISSNELSVTTMDTTSHNFTWQTFSFGGGGEASFINDVFIIDENNIWAVGEIYLPDSLGNPDNKLYNALHWDGNNWIPKRISAEFRGNIITPTINGVQAFSGTDIWFTSSLPIHGDGTTWKIFDIRTTTHPNLVASDCWGTSSSNMYFVGALGSIAYYNGQSFNKIESGTSTIINDVYGIINDNNQTIVYCPVSSFFVAGDKKILKIVDGKVDSVTWNKDARLYSNWAMNENFLYACGEGAFENKFGIISQINLPSVGTNSVRGNNINDIFIVGDYGFKTHFNGLTWQQLGAFNNNKFYSHVDIKGKTVVISGNYQGRGIVEFGRSD